MIPQPDIVAIRRHQHPIREQWIRDVQPRPLVRSPLNNDPPIRSRTGRYALHADLLFRLLRVHRRRMSQPGSDSGRGDSRPPPRTKPSPSLGLVARKSSAAAARIEIEGACLQRQFEPVKPNIKRPVQKWSGNQRNDIHGRLRTPLWEFDGPRPACI